MKYVIGIDGGTYCEEKIGIGIAIFRNYYIVFFAKFICNRRNDCWKPIDI